MNLPPFYIGEEVIVIKNFREEKKIWGFNYPRKGSIVKVLSIKKSDTQNFWLITIANCEVELCHRGFRSQAKNFQFITYKEVIERELVISN